MALSRSSRIARCSQYWLPRTGAARMSRRKSMARSGNRRCWSLDHGLEQLDQVDGLGRDRWSQLVEAAHQAHIHDQAAELRASSRICATRPASDAVDSARPGRASTSPRITLSGVRSSCAAGLRNSVLAAFVSRRRATSVSSGAAGCATSPVRRYSIDDSPLSGWMNHSQAWASTTMVVATGLPLVAPPGRAEGQRGDGRAAASPKW